MEMGEAAPCLMRSVSQPFFASCEYKEGDPLRALTTSISFGRFMTEPLDWERWSSFSHSRTLEDVQKYSRPGVVAEKKAFFEAHYKKIAAKKAAKSPKKENKAPNYSPETNAISPVTLSRNSDSRRSNSHSAIDDTGGNESTTLATNEYIPSNRHAEQEIGSIEDVCSPSVGLISSEIDYISSIGHVEQEKASIENVRSPSSNQVFPQFGNVEDNVPSGSQVEQEKASIENVSSPSTNQVFPQFVDVEDNVPSGSQVEQEKASIEKVSSPSTYQVFPQFGNVDDNMPNGSQVEQEKASIENVSSESHQFLVENSSQSSHDDRKKKARIKDAANGRDKVSGQTKPEISSSKSSSKNGVYKLQSPRKAPTPPICPRKAAIDVTEKKRSPPQSLHMSMNFPHARKNIGLYSSPFAPKNGTSKTICKSKDKPTQQALTRVSVNGVKKSSEVLPRQEIRRFKPLLDCFVNGRRKVDQKSISTSHSEASSACIKKPRSSTVPTSFSFRSEERAAKRKEFFQKLEAKSNTKEMGTIQLQPKLKEKARNDNKKLSSAPALEAKPSTSERKAPSNSMEKEKARNSNKKLHCALVLEAKPSRSEAKAPSNGMQKKKKARNDNKELLCAPALEAKPSTSEAKASSNGMEKEKARNDNKELRCAPALEVKASTSETKAPSNSMQKIMQVPPTRPCSPKLGRKPTPRLVLDTCYQSPWRSSSKPKNFIELNKKLLSSSMASLPTKKMYDSTLMSKK
ncbi:protein WVD2-like 7 [Cynara cardunculus var. scolymus]|uniref:protein WVD2-like 7 n=1 Tax=Cynara cardunculus var. scolymus TaxID=59895 RepID=UPI000D630664|nr:protein WVD2-like 7 [Cynara cardunculus var. scolymus]